MHLPGYVKKVIAAVEGAGYECYCVGGCVRNSLLSIPISDYDITTSALPDETIAALSDFKTIGTGLKHGTVTAISDSHPIEITTYRSEDAYSDHRHPDSVTFAKNLKSDLSRRDFTINAMAYNEKSGIIDAFGGKEDIERRLIKTVGNPDERFCEDALRILRALRFGSVLGFSIEEKTADSIRKNYKLLSFVSRERIYSELCRLVCGENAAEIIRRFLEVIAFILGENLVSQDALKRGADSLSSLPKEPSVRFAALLRFVGIISAEEILLSLKADKETIKRTCILTSATDISKPENRIEIKKLLRDYGIEDARNSLILSGFYNEQIEKEISDIIENGECFKISDLKINGTDLLLFGFKGKEIGAILEDILSLVIEEKLPNNKDSIISYIQKALLV